MRLLVDTHVWLWMALDPARLQASTRDALLDPSHEVYVSSATVWEMAIKIDLSKLTLPTTLTEFVAQQSGAGVASLLSVSVEHALALADLPRYHRDPFDRILIAQARHEGMTLVTADDAFRAYGVPVLWAT